jgi:hypothetical protein
MGPFDIEMQVPAKYVEDRNMITDPLQQVFTAHLQRLRDNAIAQMNGRLYVCDYEVSEWKRVGDIYAAHLTGCLVLADCSEAKIGEWAYLPACASAAVGFRPQCVKVGENSRFIGERVA